MVEGVILVILVIYLLMLWLLFVSFFGEGGLVFSKHLKKRKIINKVEIK